MAAVLRFVDSIQASPTVRLDLNDSSAWKAQFEGTFIGPPPIRRTVTTSMLRDGDPPGESSYGNRELILSLELRSATADAAATQLQLLQRELDRTTNLLQYTAPGTTNTVFFQTFRTSPDNVRWDETRKQAQVTVLAKPFALGIREDITGLTVNNNPAAGSNGLFLDLTGIKGDVETPLFIEYADGGGGLTRSGFAVGVRTGASPYPNRFYQAESMNQQTDTSVVVDATFSGGSKSRTTFATVATQTGRLSGGFPSLTVPAGAENWGVYRVYARVAQTVAGDVINMAVKVGSGAYNKAVTIKSQTQAQLVDLGVVDATSGLTTTGGFAMAEYRIEAQDALVVGVQRVSGSGSLDIDYLVFVPADECLGSWVAFADVASATHLAVIDGPNDAVYVATALSGATPGRIRGTGVAVVNAVVVVRPGDNRLVVVEASKGGTAPTTNSLTTSISATIRYWPRYLLARPVST